MQIPRFSDHDCYENLIEGINLIAYFMFSSVQIFFFLTMLATGSAFSKMRDICFYTWDKGMDMAGRKRVIMDREGKHPYLVRYYLLFCDRSEYTKFNIFIHQILKSDEDDMHDHPWGYFTCILSGGYWETVGKVECDDEDNKIKSYTRTRFWRNPWFMQRVKDTHIHRLELKKDEYIDREIPCWTLFIPFIRTRNWGFYVRDKDSEDCLVWEDSEEYIKKKLEGSKKED